MKRLLLLLACTAPATLHAEDFFAPGSEWETVTEGHQFAEGMAFDREGHLLFTDVPRSQLFRIDRTTGRKTLIDGATGRTNGIAFGPDGHLYGCAAGEQRIYRWDPTTWEKTTVAEGPHSNDIAVRKDGTIFFTDPRSQSVWRISAGDRKLEKAASLEWGPNGITLSLDQQTLLVAEFNSNRIHAFPIDAHCNLGDPRVAFVLRVPEDGKGQLDGMLVHHDGRLLSGTALGAQVAAPAPAEAVVIPIPGDLPRCNYVRLSPDGAWIYVAHAKVILRRQLAPAFGRPVNTR